ncbi:chemotaxis protein CheW [Variovorax sp. HJSM1_2]|uniref:chemotaxis protein CheW n=1 Tax=Variovorax sp. HJSM1_2 TaxID=3366263 RepID=UPI003BE63B81
MRGLDSGLNAAVGKSSSSAGQYLSFHIGAEEFGIDILSVQEIRSYEQPTRMPRAGDDVLGVVNLRGVIVPIIDLRIRLGNAQAVFTTSTVVIVLDLRTHVVGVVVDAVNDVVSLTQEMLRPAPSLSGPVDTAYINGLAQVEERMLMLLDIHTLLRDTSTVAAEIRTPAEASVA